MGYRDYPPAEPLLIAYDPVRDLPADHLARLVDQVVESTIQPAAKRHGRGQPAIDPRLSLKVLVYAYANGVRGSRQIERLCDESLPYLFLTRGGSVSYGTLCTVRRTCHEALEAVWVGMFSVAADAGIKRLGRIVVDSTKLRANASPEAVVKAREYDAVLAELKRVLEEAERADALDEMEGSGTTRLNKTIPHEHMRDILRRVRGDLARRKSDVAAPPEPEPAGTEEEIQPAPVSAESEFALVPPQEEVPKRPSAHMVERVKLAISTIKQAREKGLKHACLTDPDARMLGEGREKRIRECHSFEVAADNGLLVAGQRSEEGNDNYRLGPLVDAARPNEPEGVKAVTADSGYYAGDEIDRLVNDGIDVCVPDSNTACDLHRGQPVGTNRAKSRGHVEFTYDPATDCYRCPEGRRLLYSQEREKCGQIVRVYRAERDCRDCPLASVCLIQKNTQRRTLSVGAHQQILEQHLKRFDQPEHVERYRHRAEAVETVFGFIRGALGYNRWLLRGAERVQAEARLFKVAYQVRKVHKAWATA
jgi:transposase